MRLPGLALLTLLSFALPSSAFAGTEATKWIAAEADTWVRKGLTSSQWSSTYLRSGKSGLAGAVQRSFVRFPQSAVDDLSDKNVLRARLWVYVTRSGACHRRVRAHRLTRSFNSSTVWTNQPATSSTVEGSAKTRAGAVGCNAANWIHIPISKATIDRWTDAAVANRGLLIRATDENDGLAWHQFASMEAGSPPQLQISYNTPPDKPNLLSPADGASEACDPTFSASYADPEGGEGQVAFHVLDSAGNIVAGEWAASAAGKASWRVPRKADGTCLLEPGKSYTWRAYAHDGRDLSSSSEQRSYAVSGDAITFDGTKSTSWPYWHGCAASRITDLADDPTGIWSGPVIQIEVRNSDTNADPNCVDERTEDPRTQLVGPFNIEGDAIDRTGDTASVTFEGFSFYVPPSWPPSIPSWISLYADYGPPWGGPSDVGVRLTDGTLRAPDSNGTYRWQPAWSTPMDALGGRWVNIVQEVKRSYDEQVGYVRQWYSTDRNPLTATTFTAGKGCASVSADAKTCYRTTFGPAHDDGKLSPRIGLYHSHTITTPDPMITYFRAFRQGKSLDTVDPTTAP